METDMKDEQNSKKHLNLVLRDELTAINQYFLHAHICADWGFNKLAQKERKKSIDDMKHADRLMERIMYLEGLPNLQDLGKLLIGENVQEILKCDLDLEQACHKNLLKAIEHCESHKDYVSRELLREILSAEEDHIDWLHTQLNLIEEMGMENYLQSQT
jgi:bacterioferritin